MKMKLIFILFTTTFLFSCQNGEKTNDLQNENQILELKNKEQKNTIDNQEQKINQLEERLNRLEETQNETQGVQPVNNDYVDNDFSNYSGQYYFIVLEIEEYHFPNNEKYFYTTQVNQLSNYNDNVKYKLLDEVVSNYKNSINAIVHKGSVNKRNIFLFDSYEQASKAREKYIMN